MARFDIYRNSGLHSESTPYLLDIQSSYLDGLATRVVIPLRRRDSFPSVKLPLDLTPFILVEDIECFLDTPRLGAIPVKALGKKVVSAGEQHHDAVIDALDRLFGAF